MREGEDGHPIPSGHFPSPLSTPVGSRTDVSGHAASVTAYFLPPSATACCSQRAGKLVGSGLAALQHSESWVIWATVIRLEMSKEESEQLLRSVLLACKEGVAIKALNSDYKDIAGTDLPYKSQGFQDIESYIKSIPHVARISAGRVFGVADENTSHIYELVSRQRSNKKKRGGRGGYARGNMRRGYGGVFRGREVGGRGRGRYEINRGGGGGYRGPQSSGPSRPPRGGGFSRPPLLTRAPPLPNGRPLMGLCPTPSMPIYRPPVHITTTVQPVISRPKITTSKTVSTVCAGGTEAAARIFNQSLAGIRKRSASSDNGTLFKEDFPPSTYNRRPAPSLMPEESRPNPLLRDCSPHEINTAFLLAQVRAPRPAQKEQNSWFRLSPRRPWIPVAGPRIILPPGCSRATAISGRSLLKSPVRNVHQINPQKLITNRPLLPTKLTICVRPNGEREVKQETLSDGKQRIVKIDTSTNRDPIFPTPPLSSNVVEAKSRDPSLPTSRFSQTIVEGKEQDLEAVGDKPAKSRTPTESQQKPSKGARKQWEREQSPSRLTVQASKIENDLSEMLSDPEEDLKSLCRKLCMRVTLKEITSRQQKPGEFIGIVKMDGFLTVSTFPASYKTARRAENAAAAKAAQKLRDQFSTVSPARSSSSSVQEVNGDSCSDRGRVLSIAIKEYLESFSTPAMHWDHLCSLLKNQLPLIRVKKEDVDQLDDDILKVVKRGPMTMISVRQPSDERRATEAEKPSTGAGRAAGETRQRVSDELFFEDEDEGDDQETPRAAAGPALVTRSPVPSAQPPPLRSSYMPPSKVVPESMPTPPVEVLEISVLPLNEGTKFNARLEDLNEDSAFLTFLGEGDDYDVFFEQLDRHYKTLAHGLPIPPTLPPSGTYLAAFDGDWHRGVVEGFEGKEMLVWLGDRGFSQYFIVDQVRFLDSKFMSMPWRIAEVTLQGVQVPVSKKVQKAITTLYYETQLTATVLSGASEDGTVLPCVQLDFDDEGFDRTLNEEIVYYQKVCDVYDPANLKINSTFPACITNVTDEGRVYMSRIDSPLFNVLQTTLDSFQAGCLAAEPFESVPPAETLCLAPFEGYFFRAEVVDSLEDGRLLRIFFIDHGNEETIPAVEVKPMPGELEWQDPQAFEVTLTDLPPRGFMWNSKASDLLKEIGNGRNFTVKVDNLSASKIPSVSIKYHDENEGWKSINSFLAGRADCWTLVRRPQMSMGLSPTRRTASWTPSPQSTPLHVYPSTSTEFQRLSLGNQASFIPADTSSPPSNLASHVPAASPPLETMAPAPQTHPGAIVSGDPTTVGTPDGFIPFASGKTPYDAAARSTSSPAGPVFNPTVPPPVFNSRGGTVPSPPQHPGYFPDFPLPSQPKVQWSSNPGDEYVGGGAKTSSPSSSVGGSPPPPPETFPDDSNFTSFGLGRGALSSKTTNNAKQAKEQPSLLHYINSEFSPKTEGSYEPGTTFNCEVVTISGLRLFFVQDVLFADAFSKLMADIQSYYGRTFYKALDRNSIRVGEMYAGLYAHDNLWYRVKVMESDIGLGFEVLYVDYGNVDRLNPQSLRDLPESFRGLPPQAIKCSFKDLISPDDSEEWVIHQGQSFDKHSRRIRGFLHDEVFWILGNRRRGHRLGTHFRYSHQLWLSTELNPYIKQAVSLALTYMESDDPTSVLPHPSIREEFMMLVDWVSGKDVSQGSGELKSYDGADESEALATSNLSLFIS
ncbi:unnamed protein product [Cyprideis torosa]|uniref:Uncharacterized protein n=1 Tax=Cyprideis torosa TaxID=163714 RepID=A0A7R8W758_9CRUS|nr:unnamed protein product [Cyprideis torosa]CAG0881904.1 unnamed protein product [Cyprideis torosa]